MLTNMCVVPPITDPIMRMVSNETDVGESPEVKRPNMNLKGKRAIRMVDQATSWITSYRLSAAEPIRQEICNGKPKRQQSKRTNGNEVTMKPGRILGIILFGLCGLTPLMSEQPL